MCQSFVILSDSIFTLKTGNSHINYQLSMGILYLMKGEFQFATVVRDDDTDADDLLDRVIVDRTLGVSSSFSSVTRLGFYGVVTMQFEFRVMCESDYYGSDCTVRCTSRDDAMGHYSCDSNGNRVCLDGYSGVDCLTGKYESSVCNSTRTIT